MEVGVRVESEDLLTGRVAHVSSAYLVFVSIDEKGAGVPLPPLIAESDEEKRRMAAAERRRGQRLSRSRAT
jgi:acyl-CoA hydrolase